MKIIKHILCHPAKRLKRRLTGCCLLMVLAFILACGGLIYLVVNTAAAQSEDIPSRNVLLLIDNSNSMYEKDGIGSDPDLLRIAAARLFITYLGVDSRGTLYRLGVIFFGGEAHLQVPLTPLADDTRRAELVTLIENPARLTWTDPVEALSLAEVTLQQAPDVAAGQTVILLTDGKPEAENSSADPAQTEVVTQLRNLAADLAARKITLFVILLQNSATDADPDIEHIFVPLWEEMAGLTPPGRFYRARQSEDLLDIYHDIVVTMTGRKTAGVVVNAVVETETIRPVMVEPNLAQMTLVIRKSNPAMQVQIHQPNGARLNPHAPGVQQAGQPGSSMEEIWAIMQPQPGEWLVKLNGQGAVMVWKDYQPAPPTPTATPTPSLTPTKTPTPTPSSTPTPLPTATPTATSTPTTTPTVTVTPTQTPVPAIMAPPPEPPASAAPRNPRWWWLALPLVPAAGGIGWWLYYRRSRPQLTGCLRRLAAPAQTGQAIPARLDLDMLCRHHLQLGADTGVDIVLPSIPAHPTPGARLTAQTGLNGWNVVLHSSPIPHPAAQAVGPILVNDVPLTNEKVLKDGDVITLGAYRFRYENLRQRSSFQKRQNKTWWYQLGK